MYIYTVTVARLSIILDFFSLSSHYLWLSPLSFSHFLSHLTLTDQLSHMPSEQLSHFIKLSPTHIVDSSPIVDLLWIRSTLSDHSCWFSLDHWLGCGGLFLLIANLFFFFGWAWGCHDSDYGCGSMVLVIVGVGRWVADLFFELFFWFSSFFTSSFFFFFGCWCRSCCSMGGRRLGWYWWLLDDGGYGGCVERWQC